MNASSLDSHSKNSDHDFTNHDFANPNFRNSSCADFMAMAERELSAFLGAVTELFGSEQAERSAEDWLDELGDSDHLPSSIREWRGITARASGRLARSVGAMREGLRAYAVDPKTAEALWEQSGEMVGESF